MPNPTTCCMCLNDDSGEPKPFMVVSDLTLKAICEGCVEKAKIEIRTRKATLGGEYGWV